MAQQDEIQILLDELDTRLDRLRALYEQYFVGIEKMEPQVQKKDVERRFQHLRKIQLRNTAARFRFQALVQKYTTYITYWQRITRQIEEGTYKRDLMRQQRYGRGPQKELDEGVETELSEEVSLEDAGDDMNEIVAEAERAIAESAASAKAAMPAPASPRERMVEEVELPPDLGVDSVMPAAASAQPSTTPRAAAPAAKTGAPAVRRAGLSMFGAAPGAKTVAAGSKPASPAKPAATMKPLAVTPPANPPKAANPPSAAPVNPAGSLAPKPSAAPPNPAASVAPKPAAPAASTPPKPSTPAGPGIPARPLTPPPMGAGPGIPARPMTPPPVAVPGRPARPLTPPPIGAGPGIPVRPMTPPPMAAGPGIPARPLTPPPVAGPGVPGRTPTLAGPGIPARPLTPTPMRPAATPPQAPAPARPAAPSNGGGEDRNIRDLYERYSQSRKQTGEGDVSFDAVAKQVRDTLPKLVEKYPGADVSFDVSVKDGRTVLKPVVRKK